MGPDFVPLAPNGTPRLNTLNDLLFVASLDGGFLDQDRPGVPQGRRAAPGNPSEIMMTATAARLLGVRLGDVVPLGFYTNAQEALPAFGTPRVAARFRANVKLVGIAVLNNAVVQDDIDGAYGFGFLTPALVREAVKAWPAAGAPRPTLCSSTTVALMSRRWSRRSGEWPAGQRSSSM